MTREFRIGDRVRRINDNFNGLRVGDIVTVIGFRDGNHITVEGTQFGYSIESFELVDREYSLETLVKRANLGLGAIKLLAEKHPNRARYLDGNGEVEFINREDYSFNNDTKIEKVGE